MENNEIVPITIDLGLARKKGINEFVLTAMGSWIKSILGAMFEGGAIPANIKGTPSEIRSFANTLNKEKSYMTAFKRYGLDDARTHRNKWALNNAIKKFERTTNLVWPLK